MRFYPYLSQGLKYATYTLAAVILLIAGAALMRGKTSVPLAGRLVSPQETGVIPTVRFDSKRMIEGFTAPPDTHVLFTVGGHDIETSVAVGGRKKWENEKYWGYCFSGNEAENKKNGLIGKAMYDGRYFYSMGQRKSEAADPAPGDNNLLGILQATNKEKPDVSASVAEILRAHDTCYLMSSVLLPVGMDDDEDTANNAIERLERTDPNNPDTDRDGISDGAELFVTKTNPLNADTDLDGLFDRLEDKNANGNAETGETSPLNADTDRDGLCDGNGSGTGCPEDKTVQCKLDARGDRLCDSRPSSPIFGEDMNHNGIQDEGETSPLKAQTFNGIDDWEYKWQKFGGARPKPGTPAPQFPIPVLP